MKKRLLSLFLTFSMLLTFFPVGTVTVFASDPLWHIQMVFISLSSMLTILQQ